jgi:hypothetical protein
MSITAPSVVGLLVRSVYVQYINRPNNKSLTLSFFLFKLPAASRLIKKSVVRSRASISQHTTWMVSPRVVHAGRHLAVSTRPRIQISKGTEEVANKRRERASSRRCCDRKFEKMFHSSCRHRSKYVVKFRRRVAHSSKMFRFVLPSYGTLSPFT